MENATGNLLDVRMPGSKANIFPWLEVVTNEQTRFLPVTREVRFLPVIRRVLVDEGEPVRLGERILELEENELYTSAVGHLCSPATGVIRKWHIREDRWDSRGRWEKGSYIGDRQYTPNYGQTIVTIELAQPADLKEDEICRRLVRELIAKGERARKLNMLGALVSALITLLVSSLVIGVVVSSLALDWSLLFRVPLLFLVMGLSVFLIFLFVRKIQRNWDFISSAAFGVGPGENKCYNLVKTDWER
jgi:hypothetical protein